MEKKIFHRKFPFSFGKSALAVQAPKNHWEMPEGEKYQMY